MPGTKNRLKQYQIAVSGISYPASSQDPESLFSDLFQNGLDPNYAIDKVQNVAFHCIAYRRG
jgi:hypothetical protein